MTVQIVVILLIALGVCAGLYRLQQRRVSFTVRVLLGLCLGIALGGALQAVFGATSPVVDTSKAYLDIIGGGYVKLLQMIVMPLIMVSIVGAVLKLRGAKSLGAISALTIGTLILTTVVAAAIGVLMAKLFGLSAVGLRPAAAELARGQYLQGALGTARAISAPAMFLSFLPANPFLDLTGARKTSTIAVVIFSIMLGLAATGIADKKPQLFASFDHAVQVAHALVMRLVAMVLRLTPYGVFALMAQMLSGSSYADIAKLIDFVLASYGALLLMFLVHLAIIAAAGLDPLLFVKKILPVLIFAFTSRSSAGAIPMNVQTQTARLGTEPGIANFAASFGATIGQNGCAGIYPAMLAVMIAPTVGIDPFTAGFIGPLLAIVAIGSVGVAGVGGGATFAALIVLSALDLPVTLAGLLISVEPLIDMGRTALNVSGAITAGSLASRLLGQTDLAVYNNPAVADLDLTEQQA